MNNKEKLELAKAAYNGQIVNKVYPTKSYGRPKPTETYARLPTAKGGLQNIPPRPPSHPLSKQTQGLPDTEGFKNTVERMDRGMPVMKHKPYIPGL